MTHHRETDRTYEQPEGEAVEEIGGEEE